MRLLILILGLGLILTGCAVSPIGSAGEPSDSTSNQEWLILLATHRVRDETIIKSQDHLPLNFDDIQELITKEIEEKDILDLIHSLGVVPKLKKDELAALRQQGASPLLLDKLGQAPIRQIASTPAPKKTDPQPAPIPEQKPTSEKSNAPLATSKPRKKESDTNTEKVRVPKRSAVSQEYKRLEPRVIDPIMQR